MGVLAAVAPGSTGWTTFAVSGTTVAYLAITLLTTPLQSAGEELIYRSVVLPAAASWVRAVRPALAVGGYFVLVAVNVGMVALVAFSERRRGGPRRAAPGSSQTAVGPRSAPAGCEDPPSAARTRV